MWHNMLEALRQLTGASLLVNAWRLYLLMRKVTVLGVALQHDSFQLGRKVLGKLFGSSLPSSYCKLLQFSGQLNFMGAFVLDYKYIIRPLRALTKNGSNGQ